MGPEHTRPSQSCETVTGSWFLIVVGMVNDSWPCSPTRPPRQGRGHALTIESGWREVADTALAFDQRFT